MVYVDNFGSSFGRSEMCRMVADTDEELYQMADKIRIKRKWKQKYYFDLCPYKRELAIKFGAKEVSLMDLVRITRGKNERRRTE